MTRLTGLGWRATTALPAGLANTYRWFLDTGAIARGDLLGADSDMSRTQISIITPSFEQASYLPRMLASVKKQTLPPHEHLIFDAHSSDGSIDILKEYCQTVKFATLKVEKDEGSVSAINKGLESSSGDVLAWLNTDDGYLSAQCLESITDFFEKRPDVDIVYGRAHFVDSSGRFIRKFYTHRDADDLKNLFISGLGIPQPSVFFRRRVYERIGPLDSNFSYAFDYDYWVRMAKAGLKIVFIDKELSYATLHDEGITTSHRERQLEQCVQIVKKHYGFASSEWIERLALKRHYDSDSLLQSENDPSIKDSTTFRQIVDDMFFGQNGNDESIRAIVSHGHTGSVQATRRQLRRCGLFNSDRVILTAFNSPFYNSGLTLIAGVHKYGGAETPIFVYDAGLTSGERQKLLGFSNVFVVDYPQEMKSFFDGYLNTRNYAFKCAAIHDISKYVEKGNLVLWCDAGATPLQSLELIFNIISRDGVFFVNHDDKESWPFYNITFTHPRALKLLSATTEEMLNTHNRSTLLGYQVGGEFQPLFDEAYLHSQDPDIICGEKYPSDDSAFRRPNPNPDQVSELRERYHQDQTNSALSSLSQHFPYWGHRQDQSIFSILCARHGVTAHSAQRFCRTNNRSSEVSRTSWVDGYDRHVTASRESFYNMDSSVVIYHHRRTYTNHDGLRFNCRANDALVVLGNGPSLKGFDFNRLDGFDTIGMNAAYRYWDRIDWYPRYYACLDTVVGLSHKEAIARLIHESSSNGIRYFLLRRNLVDELPDMQDHPRVLVFDEMMKNFSLLSDDLVTTGSHAALIGAVLGYRRIYLLGIDCNYTELVPGSRKVEGYVLEIVDDTQDNPNYFIDDYQRKGDRYHVPNSSRPNLHAVSWERAGEKLESACVTVLNANPESMLTVFPFCDFKDIENILAGPYLRNEHAHIDEGSLAARLLAELPAGSIMVDVGAHHGGALSPFLRRGWRVVAFEPDPKNRARLQNDYGAHPQLTIDARAVSDDPDARAAFYTSAESTGIGALAPFTDGHEQTATVSVMTLDHVVKEYDLSTIDLLKVDTEGYDLMVLKGLPWERVKPRLVLCEFEDRKTKPLGYGFHDLAGFLTERGYAVFVSEWHPIVRYGIRHDWRRLVRYPCEPASPDAWGNLIAFRDAPDTQALRAAARRLLKMSPEANYPSEADKLPKPGQVKTAMAVDRRTEKAPAGVHRPAGSARSSTRGSRLVRAFRHRPIRSSVMRWLASPTSASLLGGLALTGAGIFGVAWGAWLAAPGLAFVGLVVAKEALLWRWRRRRDTEALRALAEAVGNERSRAQRALTEAMAAERGRAEKALAEAVGNERSRAQRALTEAMAAERGRAEKALAEAVGNERSRAQRALTEAMAAERGRAEKALAEAVGNERSRAQRVLTETVATERSRRSLVDVHLADRGLPIRRILLLFTIHRSGSTWLFDMLRTHPSVRVEPTARVWTALGMDGWRYPGAFHHADGASVPLEIAPGLAAAIPAFPPAEIPKGGFEEAERWALEKAHPQFVWFEAGRLAARVRDLRGNGIAVEIVYGVRCPLDAMWSMAEYKSRAPEWYKELPVGEIPRFIARSFEALAEARTLLGGSVIEYENLPDGAALNRLACRLAPAWGEAEAKAWLSHAASEAERYKRRQPPESPFLGERNRARDPAGPDGAWAAAGADLEAAKAAHRRLTAEE